MTAPRLTRSREDYLKALHALGADLGDVTVGALARQLAVSPPSATNMLARLAREGLLTRASRGAARLTARGLARARATVRRHRLVETFLVRTLRLDWSEAHEDAEVLEHAISDRVIEALARLMGHPQKDPHGHPIPDRRGRMPRRALVPLAELGPGEHAIVREIRDREPRYMARWKRAGLTPGAVVRVIGGAGDARTLDVGGRRAQGVPRLDGVLVERRSGGSRT